MAAGVVLQRRSQLLPASLMLPHPQALPATQAREWAYDLYEVQLVRLHEGFCGARGQAVTAWRQHTCFRCLWPLPCQPPLVQTCYLGLLPTRWCPPPLLQIWGRLVRQVAPEVAQRPELHTLLAVPYPFVVPGARFREVYYWDSYFVLQGLLASNLTDLAQVGPPGGTTRWAQHDRLVFLA